jgi:excisionase family DNA binding protein
MKTMNKTYSVSEAAKMLGYSTNSIYSFLKRGEIKATRLGKGKFRIPQKEIDRLFPKELKEMPEKPAEDKSVKEEALILPKVPKKAAEVPEVLTPVKEVVNVPESAILEAPRPGSSLADLSGETAVHTLRLWFEERVGLPKLFDWLTSLTSIILGVSLFLYSSQLDVLSLGRLSLWLNPIRLTMIFGGVGLILAAMIQEEIGRYTNLTNYFRFILAAAFLGLAVILYAGGDIDGFLVHGLFGLAILVEALSGIPSSVVYVLYIFGLLISVFVVANFFPEGSGLSMITTGLRSVFGGFEWILSLLVLLLIMAGLYGYLLNKKFLRVISFVYGVLLCGLALYYGAGNYWSRAFAVLIAGMMGMVLSYWEMFRAKLVTDRTLVFKMFGSVMLCFVVPILLVAVVQGAMVSDAYRDLADKAEFAKVDLVNTVTDLKQGATDLSGNKSFINAFVAAKNEDLVNQLRFLSLGRTDVGIVGVINAKGKPLGVYPASEVFMATDFSKAEYFTAVMKTGIPYVSKNLEDLSLGIDKDFLIAVPTVNAKNIVSGVLVIALSGVNTANELQRVGQGSLGQEVVVVGDGARVIVHPNVAKLGSVVSEADGIYDLWNSTAVNKEGYNWRGVHSLFAASRDTEYGLTVIVSQPIQKVLDVSSSWLAWMLFLLLIGGMVVMISFIFIKSTEEKERD